MSATEVGQTCGRNDEAASGMVTVYADRIPRGSATSTATETLCVASVVQLLNSEKALLAQSPDVVRTAADIVTLWI